MDAKIVKNINVKSLLIILLTLISQMAYADTGGLNSYGETFKKKYSSLVANTVLPDNNTHPGYGNGVSVYGKPSSDYQAYLGGYGEFFFFAPQHDHSSFAASIYPSFTFKYKDLFDWNTLLWIFLDQNGNTNTDLYYTYFNWYFAKHNTIEGGFFLSPIGKFERDLYYPWLNKLPTNPVGFEGSEGAALSADVGLQLLGDIPFKSSMRITYSVFVANGPRAQVEDGIIAYINSYGFNQDTDGHKALGGRLAFFPNSAFEIGVSGATGKVGLFEDDTMIESSRVWSALDVDVSYLYNPLTIYAEYIVQNVAANNRSDEDISGAARFNAWYMQGSYRLFTNWEAVIRYGNFCTDTTDERQRQVAIGIDYWFTPTIVAKLAYDFNKGAEGFPTNNNELIFQFSLGIA